MFMNETLRSDHKWWIRGEIWMCTIAMWNRLCADWSSASPPFWIWFNVMILFSMMDLFPVSWFILLCHWFAVMLVYINWIVHHWSRIISHIDLIVFLAVIKERFEMIRFGEGGFGSVNMCPSWERGDRSALNTDDDDEDDDAGDTGRQTQVQKHGTAVLLGQSRSVCVCDHHVHTENKWYR